MADSDKGRSRRQTPSKGGKPASASSGQGSYGSGKRASGKKTSGNKAAGRASGTGSRGASGRSRNPSQGGYKGSKAGSGKGRSSTGEPAAVDSKRGFDSTKQQPKRRDLRGAAVDLPRWVVDELTRVTAKERVAGALEDLGEAAAAFTDGRYHQAVRRAERAKQSAPRDATVREILGLAAYRVGDWQTALRELRTYRRFTGETTHLPVEMDVLRALKRDEDVESAWQQLQDLGARPAVTKEGIVVYGSYLADLGRLEEAAKLVMPRRIKDDPFEEDLRVWYVASRVAAMQGNRSRAMELRNAILASDPAFPGIDELESMIANVD
jgi:hypothetical protein